MPKINWKITAPDEKSINISLADVNSGNENEKVSISGDNELKEQITAELERSYGVVGHQISLNSTTAFDLDAALQALQVYDVNITEGKEIFKNGYDLGIPKGANS